MLKHLRQFKNLSLLKLIAQRLAYHPDADVYFQKNAWADTEVSVEWANKTLAAAVEGLDRFVLFMDNLTAQQSSKFKEAVSSHHGVCRFGLPNRTDLWQVVDVGISQLLKNHTSKEQDEWLMDEENATNGMGIQKTKNHLQNRRGEF